MWDERLFNFPESQMSITGKCQHGVYNQKDDPCFGCGFCTIDGNDYSDFSRPGAEKPLI